MWLPRSSNGLSLFACLLPIVVIYAYEAHGDAGASRRLPLSWSRFQADGLQKSANNGSISLVRKEKIFSFYMFGLYGLIDVGTPSQSIFMTFHLHSARTWLVNRDVHKSQWGTYQPSRSTSFRNTSVQWTEGDITGWCVADTISIVGSGISVANQQFELINSMSPQGVFFLWSPEGIGIGPSTSNNTFLHNVGSQLGKKMISIWTKRMDRITEYDWFSPSSEVKFGEIDDRCGESPYFVDSVDSSWCYDSSTWGVPLSTISVANAQIHVNVNVSIASVIGIMAPRSSTDAIVRALGVEVGEPTLYGGYPLNCANHRELPDMLFKVGRHTFRLTSSDYVYKVCSDLNEVPCECFIALVPNFVPQCENDWVIGGRFFNSMCLVIDFESNRVGFSPSKPA